MLDLLFSINKVKESCIKKIIENIFKTHKVNNIKLQLHIINT